MAKVFAAKRFLDNLATWANETTDPNSGAGTPANKGSMWLQAGGGASAARMAWLKLNSTDKGWVKQNWVNLNVFNVKNYGALGDGTTNDGPAVATTIAAAIAAGGGIIYFPGVFITAGQAYKFIKPALNLGSIFLRNVNVPLWFRGDGYSSKLSMIGSAAAGDWHLIRMTGTTSRQRISNLHFDGSGITSPDPGDQNHFISLEGLAADNAGPNDIEIDHNWFGPIVGDMIRPIGSNPSTVVNVRVHHNAQDADHCRSFIEAQRGTRRFSVYYNWMWGSDDNDVDFEPTGGGADVAPREWLITGNIIEHQSRGTAAITTSGIGSAQPTLRCVFAHNIIANGGQIYGLDVQDCLFEGNVLQINNTLADGCINLFRVVDRTTIGGNCLVSLTAVAGRSAVKLASNAGFAPTQCVVDGNVGRANEGSAIRVEAGRDVSICGNLMSCTNAVAGTIGGVVVDSIVNDIDRFTSNKNMLLATGANISIGVNYHAQSGQTIRNTAANHNYIRGVASGVVWNRAGAEVFLDWRSVAGNNVVGATAATISISPTTKGLVVEGNAGPGAQIGWINNASGPEGNIEAPKGSLCTNVAGSNSNVMFYKDTGIFSTNTGWARVGADEIVMGALTLGAVTAARYLAPGVGLLSASSTEIQLPVPRPGTMRNLRINCIAGVGPGNVTVTVRKNGVATTLTVTMLNTATSGSDTTHSFTVAAGDLISVQVTKDTLPVSAQANMAATFELSA